MTINAVYDACVLYPNYLRDFLLQIAGKDIVVPYWTEEIHKEWTSRLLENRPELQQEKIGRIVRAMNHYFPNSTVEGYEWLIPKLNLPDPKDRHVLAAAIQCEAQYIVTLNQRDFPVEYLSDYQIEAIKPDDFAMRLFNSRQERLINLIRCHRGDLSRPVLSAEEYVAMLERQQLPQTAAFLRKHLTDI